MTISAKRSILLTGAAGRVGSVFYHATFERFRFRLADRDISSLNGLGGYGADIVALTWQASMHAGLRAPELIRSSTLRRTHPRMRIFTGPYSRRI